METGTTTAKDDKIMTYADFMPRSAKVLVGDKEMSVREYSIAKRDAVFRVVLASSGAVELAQAVFSMARKNSGEGEDSRNESVLKVLLDGLRDVASKLLGRELTVVACLTMDVPENRAVAGLGIDEKIVTSDIHGFEFSPAMFAYVRDNLTIRQEQALLEAVFSVNDFSGIIKKYKALVVAALKTTGVMKS